MSSENTTQPPSTLSSFYQGLFKKLWQQALNGEKIGQGYLKDREKDSSFKKSDLLFLHADRRQQSEFYPAVRAFVLEQAKQHKITIPIEDQAPDATQGVINDFCNALVKFAIAKDEPHPDLMEMSSIPAQLTKGEVQRLFVYHLIALKLRANSGYKEEQIQDYFKPYEQAWFQDALQMVQDEIKNNSTPQACLYKAFINKKVPTSSEHAQLEVSDRTLVIYPSSDINGLLLSTSYLAQAQQTIRDQVMREFIKGEKDKKCTRAVMYAFSPDCEQVDPDFEHTFTYPEDDFRQALDRAVLWLFQHIEEFKTYEAFSEAYCDLIMQAACYAPKPIVVSHLNAYGHKKLSPCTEHFFILRTRNQSVTCGPLTGTRFQCYYIAAQALKAQNDSDFDQAVHSFTATLLNHPLRSYRENEKWLEEKKQAVNTSVDLDEKAKLLAEMKKVVTDQLKQCRTFKKTFPSKKISPMDSAFKRLVKKTQAAKEMQAFIKKQQQGLPKVRLKKPPKPQAPEIKQADYFKAAKAELLNQDSAHHLMDFKDFAQDCRQKMVALKKVEQDKAQALFEKIHLHSEALSCTVSEQHYAQDEKAFSEKLRAIYHIPGQLGHCVRVLDQALEGVIYWQPIAKNTWFHSGEKKVNEQAMRALLKHVRELSQELKDLFEYDHPDYGGDYYSFEALAEDKVDKDLADTLQGEVNNLRFDNPAACQSLEKQRQGALNKSQRYQKQVDAWLTKYDEKCRPNINDIHNAQAKMVPLVSVVLSVLTLGLFYLAFYAPISPISRANRILGPAKKNSDCIDWSKHQSNSQARRQAMVFKKSYLHQFKPRGVPKDQQAALLKTSEKLLIDASPAA